MKKEETKVVFDTPLVFEGKEYKEITMDFEKMSGKNLIEASREARAIGLVNPSNEFCPVYLACVAAKAASVPIDLIFDLPGNEFTAVKSMVQNFLLAKAL